MNIGRFLAMGGYAVYVWPCYALAALVVGLNLAWARRSLRSAQREARRRLEMLKVDSSP
ncbi:MAG TPA: heme exporter protein CcmD [Steroidobacteraceae bacterium]|jgi:heme exporter protein CcmD|nr:heme exporter protein CcmD [Steroidobacteraceae bacterium]